MRGLKIHTELVNLQKQYELLVSNVQAGYIAPNDAFVTLSSMTAIDADGYIWSMDINGEFRRSQGGGPPVITNPELFSSLENVHYKVNNQRPIEEVNYDLPPTNFSYRNNTTDYPEPEGEPTPRKTKNNSSNKLTKLPSLNFLSKISLSKLRTPFIVIVCLIVAIVAIGGSKKPSQQKSELNTENNQSVVTQPEKPNDNTQNKPKEKISLLSDYMSEKTKIESKILTDEIKTSKNLESKIYYGMQYLVEKGYKTTFLKPSCSEESCLIIVKMSLKNKETNFTLTINKSFEDWVLKEIK